MRGAEYMYIFPAEEQNKEHNHISLSLAARVDREKQKRGASEKPAPFDCVYSFSFAACAVGSHLVSQKAAIRIVSSLT